ncbi:MAG: hypothetical protein AB7L09_26055 [Nitrospira sp.]
MMDWSAVIYAGLMVGGAIVVLLMVLWTLSTESSTVSISGSPVSVQSHQADLRSFPKAA